MARASQLEENCLNARRKSDCSNPGQGKIEEDASKLDHEELIRRSRWIHEQVKGAKAEREPRGSSYQNLRSKSPRGSTSPLSSTRNEDNKVFGEGEASHRRHHDDSFNSQSNRDQKSLRLLQQKEQRGRMMTSGGDRSNVHDILANFNREKE